MANLQLRYGTKKHDDLREALRERIKHADHAIDKRETKFADSEDQFMAYIKETDADALRRVKKDDGNPQYVNIEIPYSYAVLMSWHTYISSVFLSRAPVMQYMGRHGETEQQIQALEAIMDYQTLVGSHLVPYYIWLLDAGKYGVGVVGNYWDEEYTQVSEIVEQPASYLGIPISGKTKKVKQTRRQKGYSGNKLFNVRPQDFIFDSRVSLMHFQEGEFAGRYFDLGWNSVVKREAAGQYYNIDALKTHKKKNRKGAESRDTGSPRLELPDAITNENSELRSDMLSPDFINGVELTVELIPNDWGIGSSTYPEKWVFTLAEDEVIIESQPYDSLHGKFPFSVLEYEMEGYGLQKRGMLEMLDPLQDTMSWLVNTHFYNVRQVLNGQFIADPSRLTIKDFKGDGAGRIIRMKPTAYGQDIRSMFHQIQTTDVTQAHLKDAQVIGELIQRVSGVTDNIMGAVNPGGRKSATEIRSSNSFGGSRLKTQAEYFSAMGFSPLSQMMVQNTQQKYDGEQKFKIAGDLLQQGQQFMQVNPENIAGAYDFVPVDGTMPVDRFAQVQMWTNLMTQMRSMPEVGTQYDFGQIFAWVAQLGGLKNINRFKIGVLPPGVAASEAGKGNLIPIGGSNGGGNSGTNGGASSNATGVPGAGQIEGMGPTA